MRDRSGRAARVALGACLCCWAGAWACDGGGSESPTRQESNNASNNANNNANNNGSNNPNNATNNAGTNNADNNGGVVGENDPGTVTLHRLNREEYNNTVRDLLGTRLRPADDFPADNHSFGFDNIADALSLSPFQIELYDRAAELLVDEALRKPPTASDVYVFEAEELGSDVGARWRDSGWVLSAEGKVQAQTSVKAGRYTVEVKAFGEQAGDEPVKMAVQVDSAQAQVFDVTADRAAPGVYRLNLELTEGIHTYSVAFLNDLYEPNAGLDRNLIVDQLTLTGPDVRGPEVARWEAETLASDNGRPDEGGFLLWSEGALEGVANLPDAGRYVVVVSAKGDYVAGAWSQLALEVDGQELARLDIATAGEAPLLFEVEAPLMAGAHAVSVRFVNDYWDEAAGLDRNVFVDWFAVLGPVDRPQADPESRRRVLTCDPAQAGKQACAEQILREFGGKAWRRPLRDEEVRRLYGLFELAEAEGDDFEQGVRLAMQAILVSPHFLFRVEQDPDPLSTAPRPLTDHELAARLSYFLWSSMPDARLQALADQGKLQDDATLGAEVERMLDDPKAEALVENFGGQWLYFKALPDARPDYDVFGGFSEELRAAMYEETRLFLRDFLLGQRPLPELLTSRTTYLNDVLARHYGLDGVDGYQMRQVDLTGTPRQGFLSQASLLTVTSHPTRTSPVKRGKWVLEQLLCSPPPPPPPGVENLIDGEEGGGGTLRERTERHRADPNCAGCHALMDPIGFGLEHYDGIGAWRAQDEGFDIDASGELPTGERFDGAAQMAELLAQDERLVRCASRQLLTYALGRGVEDYDRNDLRALSAGLAGEDGLKMRALIKRVVLSEPFRWRRGDPTPVEREPSE